MKKFFVILATLFSVFALSQSLKISELTSLTNAGLATNDVFPIVDTSATTTKKFAVSEFDLRYAFTVTAPLSKTAGASPVVSIPLATSSQNGYLSSTDWSTFNNKQATVSANAPITFSSNTIAIPVATSSANGYLSSTDWSTFNNKVSLTGTEALTNKDYDGGTASNTSRITLPKAAKTTLDALTRKQGTIVFDTTSNKPYYDDGSTLKVVGSGSGGAKNFIEGGDAESGTTGWSTFDDGAATSPVNGTGGSPSVVTWSTSSSTPLENANSFTYVKTGSDAQGEGVAYTFSVDPAWRAKVLTISFDYILSSGTFTAGTSSANSDVTVWLYDVTNSQLIQPSSFKFLSNSTTNADKFESTFQTSAAGASYRFILFSGTTSTSAYTLKIDNVAVSPSNYAFGTPVTDWQTATITSNFTNQTTLAKKRRIGDSMQYSFQTKFSGAPGAVTGAWTLPDIIDATKLSQGAISTVDSRGICSFFDASTSANYVGSVAVATSTTINIFVHGTSAAVSNTVPVTFANNDYIECLFTVPISGLSSSVQMSDQTSTRIVSFRAYKSGGNQNGTSGVVSYTSVEDTHGGFDLSAGTYTVKVPGDYHCGMNNEWTAAQTATFIFRVNGSGKGTYSSTASSNYAANSHLIRNLVAGDVLNITSSTGSSLNLVDLWFYCSRVAGPNQIAASEKVYFTYTHNSGQSTTAGVDLNLIYNNKITDSHNIYDTSTGRFTFPKAMRCKVSMGILIGAIDPAAGSYTLALISKNGSNYRGMELLNPDLGSQTYPATLSASIEGNAGDYFQAVLVQGLGSTTTYTGSDYATYNYLDLDCN